MKANAFALDSREDWAAEGIKEWGDVLVCHRWLPATGLYLMELPPI